MRKRDSQGVWFDHSRSEPGKAIIATISNSLCRRIDELMSISKAWALLSCPTNLSCVHREIVTNT